jgi:hypothetical protein
VDQLLLKQRNQFPLSGGIFGFSGPNCAEAPAASGSSLAAYFREHSPSFTKLEPYAQLSQFARAFAFIDPKANRLQERADWVTWLTDLHDQFCGDPIGHRAERLLEEVIPY